MSKRDIKILLVRNGNVAVLSLILHGIWEYVACGMFYAYSDIPNMNRLMVEATIGDVGIALLIFNLILLIRKDMGHKLIFSDYAVVILYGVLAAYYFETRALGIDRWIYNAEMTLIPMLKVGLVPVLQLVILLPFTFIIERFTTAHLRSRRQLLTDHG